jgi:hypothetical protein
MKKNPSPGPPNLKAKKTRHFESVLGPSHWLHEISLPQRVCHHFWLGLVPLAKNTLPIEFLEEIIIIIIKENIYINII